MTFDVLQTFTVKEQIFFADDFYNEGSLIETPNPKELQENRSSNKKCKLISHHTQSLIDTTDQEGLQERNRLWNEKTITKCKLTSHHTQTDVAW